MWFEPAELRAEHYPSLLTRDNSNVGYLEGGEISESGGILSQVRLEVPGSGEVRYADGVWQLSLKTFRQKTYEVLWVIRGRLFLQVSSSDSNY